MVLPFSHTKRYVKLDNCESTFQAHLLLLPHIIICTVVSLPEWGSVTETSKWMLLHDLQKDHLQFFPSLPFISFPILPRYHIYPTIRQAPFMIRKIPTQSMFNFVHIYKAPVPNLFYEWALHEHQYQDVLKPLRTVYVYCWYAIDIQIPQRITPL